MIVQGYYLIHKICLKMYCHSPFSPNNIVGSVADVVCPCSGSAHQGLVIPALNDALKNSSNRF